MATKKAQAGEVEGLALVDIPRLGAKSGEWITVPAGEAKSLTESGEFDAKAQKPE